MNGNLLEAIQSLVKVKKVDADVVFDALEMVLLTAYKKETGSNAKTSIKLNRETGDYQIFEEKTVVESKRRGSRVVVRWQPPAQRNILKNHDVACSFPYFQQAIF